jgi:parvulin-like peptidyl-prolyl isomerase
MRSQYVDRFVRVSPAQVKAAFTERGQQLAAPAKVKLRMMVAAGVSGKKQLEEALKQLQAGASFAGLAKEISIGSHASEGGDRGWMALPDLRKELREAAEKLEKGQVSPVVKAGSKFYLLKVDDLAPSETILFEDAAPILEQELRAEVAHDLFREWIESLRHDAYVRVVEESPF